MAPPWTSTFATDLLAGGAAAAVTKTVAAPIERVKLLMQTQAANRDIPVGQQYRHTWDCIVRVYREQGMRSFWRGNVASVLRYFPQQALTFATKDQFQAWFAASSGPGRGQGPVPVPGPLWQRAVANLVSGGVAGGTALLAAYPLDVVRTRMATDVRSGRGGTGGTGGTGGGDNASRSLRGCVRQMWVDGGVGAFYRGLPVALTGVVVFKVMKKTILRSVFVYFLLNRHHQALHMGGYDTAKGLVASRTGGHDGSVWLRLAMAQVITTGAGTLCFPFDTVKRRLMVQEQQLTAAVVAAAPSPVKYNNGIHCVRVIIREEGVAGLYAGLPANLIRGISGSILLVGYDEAKKFLQPR